MSKMQRPADHRPDPRQRRAHEQAIDRLVARAIGVEPGPLFDRPAVAPALVDEFIRSDEVRLATRNFAAAMVGRWKALHPGGPALRLATKALAAYPFEVATAMSANSFPDPVDAAAIQPAAGAAAVAAAAAAAAPAGRAPDRGAVFKLPNAKSGQEYDFAIVGTDAVGRDIPVVDAKLPPETGLAFDSATQRVRGTADRAGDYPVTLQWQDEGGERRTGALVMIVNAQPRDLWKTIDADPSDPYFKPNEDARFLLLACGLRVAAGSKRGRSHAHAGTCRDDDFFVCHDAASGWSVLLVADGAGSARSSRKGAQLASRSAGRHLATALAAEEGVQLVAAAGDWQADPAAGARRLKEVLYNLFGRAALAGLQAIEEEASARAAPVKDYSTTLLCAVHRKSAGNGDFVASFWIGDGAVCAYGPSGHADLMGRPDSGEFAGQTRFLDRAVVNDPSALWQRIEFRRFDSTTPLTALILLTDGISDPRFETDNGLADAARWDALWSEIGPALAAPDPAAALVEWMDFFSPGHHDDRTIALLWQAPPSSAEPAEPAAPASEPGSSA